MQGKPWGRKSLKFKVHSLIDKVYKPLNLYIAWEKVKANKGSGGIDRVSIEGFDENLAQNLDEIHRLLKEDRYSSRASQEGFGFPSPIKTKDLWVFPLSGIG